LNSGSLPLPILLIIVRGETEFPPHHFLYSVVEKLPRAQPGALELAIYLALEQNFAHAIDVGFRHSWVNRQ
jgi:hypothetical protein